MSQVYRCYTEKMKGFAVEAEGLLSDLRLNLGIDSLTGVRILCRYDAEGLTAEEYEKAKQTVFSEPMCDVCYDEEMPVSADEKVLIVEPLPGQYDQR